MIAIIDFKMGNLGSIKNMLNHIGVESTITSSLEEIEFADKLILPGVGKFDYGMRQLNESGLAELIKKKVLVKKTPILGICLGMQLLTGESEEGNEKGLALIDARVRKFNFPQEDKLKVPHMGWNSVFQAKESAMMKDFSSLEDNRFYFVHSYYVDCFNQQDILLNSNYGHSFCSVFQHENIIGCQFHPEKSHKFGMKFLKNFAEI